MLGGIIIIYLAIGVVVSLLCISPIVVNLHEMNYYKGGWPTNRILFFFLITIVCTFLWFPLLLWDD